MEFTKKLIGDKEERAVSPVIGVILMVAITVILAAVIAAFVLDLGSGLDSDAQASVSISNDGTTDVTVDVRSLQDADGVAVVDSSGSLHDNKFATSVGATITVDGGTSDEDYTVLAYFGGEQDGEREGEAAVGSFTYDES